MFKRLFTCLLCVAMISGCVAFAEQAPGYDVVYSSENPIPEIAERVRPSVVEVTASVESWNADTRIASVEPYSNGSGCYILKSEDDEGGYILTNYHIVENCDAYSIRWLGGETMDVELVGYDNGTDIAVLKFKEAAPENAEVIPMGDSDALRIGELAICIGNPGSSNEVLYATVTAGIISGLEREDINASNFTHNVNTIQTDAAINTGNSGGALLNSRGELVGIPTLKLMYGITTIYEGLGFCVPINTVKDFISQIITTGAVVRPRLGMTVVNIDGPEDAMKKYPPIGVQVYTVEENGPSAAAGLQVNDVITEIDGVRLKSYTQLIKEVDKHKAGDTVELKVYRYYDAAGELTGTYEELYFTVQLALID